MGLLWFTSKDGIVRHEVEEQLKQKGPLMDWLKANKALVGIIVSVVAGALYACPDPHCQTAYHFLVVIGPSLIAAGVLPADAHVQAAQDYAKNGVDRRTNPQGK